MDNNQRLSFEREFFKKLDSELVPLKENVSSLKENVSSLKENVSSLKENVSSLKENVSSLKESVSSLEQNIDTRVESKINSMLLKHLGVKWQSLSIILTAFGIQLALVFFIINTSVSPMKEDIKQLKKDVRSLITMHYKNTDRKPSSNTDKY